MTHEELIDAVLAVANGLGWKFNQPKDGPRSIFLCGRWLDIDDSDHEPFIADAAVTELANRGWYIVDDGRCGLNDGGWLHFTNDPSDRTIFPEFGYDPAQPGARARATILAAAEAVEAMRDE